MVSIKLICFYFNYRIKKLFYSFPPSTYPNFIKKSRCAEERATHIPYVLRSNQPPQSEKIMNASLNSTERASFSQKEKNCSARDMQTINEHFCEPQ